MEIVMIYIYIRKQISFSYSIVCVKVKCVNEEKTLTPLDRHVEAHLRKYQLTNYFMSLEFCHLVPLSLQNIM